VMRRVRPREMFFPLPRLGDLPALAARIAHASDNFQFFSGSSGKEWKPGRVKLDFNPQFQDDRNGRGASSFREFQPHLSEIESRPRMVPVTQDLTGLVAALRVELPEIAPLLPATMPSVCPSEPVYETSGAQNALVPQLQLAPTQELGMMADLVS